MDAAPLMEEVIVGEEGSVLLPLCVFAVPLCCRQAEEGATWIWQWHGSPVWRQGDTDWK